MPHSEHKRFHSSELDIIFLNKESYFVAPIDNKKEDKEKRSQVQYLAKKVLIKGCRKSGLKILMCDGIICLKSLGRGQLFKSHSARYYKAFEFLRVM